MTCLDASCNSRIHRSRGLTERNDHVELCAVLNPTERMDMLWMGKQLPPTPKFLRDAGRGDPKLSHASPSSPSVLAATPPGVSSVLDAP